MEHYLSGVLTTERAGAIFREKAGTSRPVDRIAAILGVSPEPIVPAAEPNESLASLVRKKIRPWTNYEDQRLLAGIHRYGLDNWTVVSEFVGNQRTRAQCSQRWYRGLDPRISKVLWTAREEERLCNLVQMFGDRAWIRVAAELGNRSDAQCRYHYRHMLKRAAEPEGAETQRADNFLCTKGKLPPISEFLGREALSGFLEWRNQGI
jgi:hypothetical protein